MQTIQKKITTHWINIWCAIKHHLSVLAENRMTRSSLHFPSAESLHFHLGNPCYPRSPSFFFPLFFLSSFSFPQISSSIFSSVIVSLPAKAASVQHRGIHSEVTVFTDTKPKKMPKKEEKLSRYKQIIVGGTLIVLLMCIAAILFQALVPGRKFSRVEKGEESGKT